VKCHACGQDNADRALFCAQCRRPLVAPTKVPTRLEPLAATAAPAMAGAAVGGARPAAAHERFAPPNAAYEGRGGDESGVLTEEEAWSAVVGDSNAHYYLERFERLSHGESGGWNWPAMLVTWYWLLYRKMWVGALVYFFVPSLVGGVISAVMRSAALPAMVAWWAALFIVPAVMANGWYFRHCQKKIRDVRARGGSKEQMVARLEAAGGTSNIVVIIVAVFAFVAGIGMLAAVALPAYQTYTVKAKVAEAVLVGAQVAGAVGQQYQQTGALPSAGDVDRIAAAHPSRFLHGVEIDGATGVLTLKVQVPPSIEGSVLLMPNADADRHLSWTCMSEDLKRYMPPSCRGQGTLAH
jgi:type II secretory pathway pseudopilin PulG